MSTTTATTVRATFPTQRAPRPTVERSAAAAGQVRLTRRGRLVVTVLLLGLLLVGFTFFSGYSSASGDAGVDIPSRTVVVSEGDTLWAIASEVAEPGEIREMVHRIQKLNSLPGPSLVEGQELAVPVG